MLEVLPFGEDPDLLVSAALMLSQLLPPWDEICHYFILNQDT